MFSAADYTLWLLGFILEAVALAFTLRNFPKLKILWIYLGWRVLGDVAGFVTLLAFPGNAYDWVNYAQKMLQFILLGALAMYSFGAAAGERMERVRPYSVMAVLGVFTALLVGHIGQAWSMPYLLTLGMRMDAALGFLVGIALLLRELEPGKLLPMVKPWPLISAALLIAVSSDGVLSTLRAQHLISMMAASRLMACGQIFALSVFAMAAFVKTGADYYENIPEAVRVDVVDFSMYGAPAVVETLTREEAEMRWPGSTRTVN